MNERERLIGVARTLTGLADGLVQNGFIDPEESSSDYGVLQELKRDVDEADTGQGVDGSRIALLFLQVVRIAELGGVNPTVSQSDDSNTSVELTDIASGLELLTQLPERASIEIRGVATAISVLMDYVYIIVASALEGTEQGDLDFVKISRGAVAVAEISVRKALDDEIRGKISVPVLRQCANSIEAEEPKPEATGQVEDNVSGE